jgi:hypothetical protein
MPWECARPVDRPPAPQPMIRTQDSSPLIYAAKPGAVKGLAIGGRNVPPRRAVGHPTLTGRFRSFRKTATIAATRP